MTDKINHFNKQQNRHNEFVFRRKFKGLNSTPTKKESENKLSIKYIVLAIIYVAILILLYTYGTF